MTPPIEPIPDERAHDVNEFGYCRYGCRACLAAHTQPLPAEPTAVAALRAWMQKIVDLWPGYEANGMQMSDYAYEAFSIARQALAPRAIPASTPGQSETLTDEQIDRKVLDALSVMGSREAWNEATFESGPYSINRVKAWVTQLARALQSSTGTPHKETK